MNLRLLAALLASCLLAAQEPETFTVQVIQPDYVFRFAPRVDLPGRPSLALVLSGGGARAVADIGVIQRLEELGIPVDSITGTSAGALMGALMACGFSGQEIEELFTRLDFNRAFLDPLGRGPGRTLQEDEAENGSFLSFQVDGGVPSFALSLRDGVEIQRTLEGLLARGAYFSSGGFDGLKIPLRVVATCLETGEGRIFQDGDLVEVLRASMAVPGAFSPVLIGGQHYVDGALVENLPVFVARDSFHPDLTLGVDVSTPLAAQPVSNFFSLAARSLDLVVERRQWESRAAASILVRPELKDVDFTDYGAQLPALVAAGRRAFDAQLPALRAAMLDPRGGDAAISARRWEFQSPSALRPEALLMLGRVLPEGRPIRRQDVTVALQQMLLHGWAETASAAVVPVAGEPVLQFRFVPFRPVRQWRVEAPAPWRGRLEAELAARFPLGEPFNPEAFGSFLGDWVHRILMDGIPLVDVRGSCFQGDQGLLTVVVREPRVRTVTIRDAGTDSEARYLKARMQPLVGGALRTARLRETINLAERRLHLMELRYQLRPLPAEDAGGTSGVDLTLVPVHHRSQALALNLGYESNLGGETGFTYRTVNFGGVGVEGELSGARNRLQDQVQLAIRGPVVSDLPGAGVELWTRSSRQRLDLALSLPNPSVPRNAEGVRLAQLDLGTGWFARFGNLGQGKAGLDAIWREARFGWVGDARSEHQRVLELSTEWDDFDRHTFPRNGLLLRGRYGYGETLAASGPDRDFRFAYMRARGLTAFGSGRSPLNPGLDLDLEWGYGRDAPLDRWWALGGSSFLLGSRSQGYLAPNFLVGRLGLPVRMPGPFGLSFQAVPRIDYGMVAVDPARLFGPDRGLAGGLLLRTILAKFYVELSYGFLRTRDPVLGWGRASGSFNATLGTQPFDFWNQK